MTVTRLRPAPRRPGFVAVEVDGVRRGVLPAEVVRELGLEIGTPLDGDAAPAVLEALERQAAYDAAVRLLAARGRSTRELVARLRRKGLGPAAVTHAVGRLEAEGLVDDTAFAEQYARSRAARGWGPVAILADLRRRGVERRLAERTVGALEGSSDEDARAELRRLAARRVGTLTSLPRETARRRLLSFLGRRGFRMHDVFDVVDEVLPPQ